MRFEAVALLGLAEGAFPAVLREDTFLRSDNREALREAGIPVDPPLRSEEAALFYVAMTRTEKRMVITRPRLAQGGAEWQPSPYWRRLVADAGVEPDSLSHETMLDGVPAASCPELMQALALYDVNPHRSEMEKAAGDALEQWRHGHRVVKGRISRRGKRRSDVYDGDLTHLAPVFSRRFGPDHTWSLTRIEAYRECPYRFFASSVLHLEDRPEPVLGLDNRQLGNIYHAGLERVFREGADEADDAEALIAIWDAIADDLLDEAPETEGFRPTAWWPQTREQIKETMRATLTKLAEENRGWRPRAFEARFGQDGEPALVVPREDGTDDRLRLRGVIDRVDTNGQGDLRVIDYKRGSVVSYNDKSLSEGKKLQLPLYALAASEARGFGRLVDGFYWSITQAEPSRLRLGKFSIDKAVTLALAFAWEAVDGARSGTFSPQAPSDGCPDFCPAAAFCWHYRPKSK